MVVIYAHLVHYNPKSKYPCEMYYYNTCIFIIHILFYTLNESFASVSEHDGVKGLYLSSSKKQ